MQGLATRLSLHRLPRPTVDVWGDVPYVPNIPGPMNLGTPAEAKRSRWILVGNVARNAAIAVALVGAGLVVGHNLQPNSPTFEQRIQTMQKLTPRQAVMLAPSAKRKCAFDWNEQCVACTHVTDLGEIIKTSMC